MIEINPRKIVGSWHEGYALDKHVIKSEYMGHNESGHAQFDTTRSEIGQLLFKLKYRSDQSVIPEIAEVAAHFLKDRKPIPDLIIPVTPSKVRSKQPVFQIGEEIAKRLKIPFSSELVTRREALPELKNISHEERRKLLKNAHDIDKAKIAGRNILLLDDLFQTGSSMNAICDGLLEAGAKRVLALALTQGNS